MNEGKRGRAGVRNRWKDCGMDEEEGRRGERDLIFSNVIQSSEVLVLPLRLYDTVMLGSE